MSREIKLDKDMMIVSRTDTKGIIEYANPHFSDVTGYELSELIGKPHNIVRHPDMPSVIFKLMWQRIQNGQDIFAVVKNSTKSGDYYWVTTKFDIKKHPFDNKITGFVAYRQGAAPHIVETISKLYKELLSIEKASGIEASEKYLIGFLEAKGLTYDEYIDQLVGKSGPFKSFFKKMSDMFG